VTFSSDVGAGLALWMRFELRPFDAWKEREKEGKWRAVKVKR
jgi:hypothetical protein